MPSPFYFPPLMPRSSAQAKTGVAAQHVTRTCRISRTRPAVRPSAPVLRRLWGDVADTVARYVRVKTPDRSDPGKICKRVAR